MSPNFIATPPAAKTAFSMQMRRVYDSGARAVKRRTRPLSVADDFVRDNWRVMLSSHARGSDHLGRARAAGDGDEPSAARAMDAGGGGAGAGPIRAAGAAA